MDKFNNKDNNEQKKHTTNNTEINPSGVDGTLPDLIINLKEQEQIDYTNALPDIVLGSLG